MKKRTPTTRISKQSERDPLRPPTADSVLEAVFAISKEITFGMAEEELVSRYARMLATLFPGRCLGIRLVDPLTLELASLFAEGTLRKGIQKAALTIRPSAVVKTKLMAEARGKNRLRITNEYEPMFEKTRVQGI